MVRLDAMNARYFRHDTVLAARPDGERGPGLAACAPRSPARPRPGGDSRHGSGSAHRTHGRRLVPSLSCSEANGHIQWRGPSRGRSSGFTVIELLVGLTVMAVLMALATPSLQQYLRNMRLASSMSDLRSDTQLARSESIKRNSRVLVCPRANPTSMACAAAVAPATWMNGWLVCYDTDADTVCDASTAADPNPIRVRASLTAPLALTGPAASVIFFPVGNANAAATFTATTAGTSRSRSISVASSGALSSSETY